MHSCLAIDVAKGKSMVTLVSSSGEVLIDPYEVNHSINDFTNLLNRIKKHKLDDISVIMESTGIYHRPIERFFLENNFKVFVINPIYGKMKKRNLRKTKTDKEDCFNLVNLFMSNTFKEYIKPDQLYLDLNALSRQYFALDELCVNILMLTLFLILELISFKISLKNVVINLGNLNPLKLKKLLLNRIHLLI